MSISVQKVPVGMHTLTPHLVCDDAVKAIEFYQRAFNAREEMRLPGPDGRLMHARLTIGDSALMLVDAHPEWGALCPKAIGGTPVTIHMYVDDADAVYAQAVAAGATAKMPVEETFWGDRYGVLVDPFGHSWSIATHVKDLTPEQIASNMQAMC